MECKDLMIGDWVNWNTYLNKPDYCKIKQLQVDTRIENGDILNCEPIPLTEEILKANYITECKTFNGGMVASRIVYCHDNEFMIIKGRVIPAKITYVHELQHLLRLCGFPILADNFKLKADE